MAIGKREKAVRTTESQIQNYWSELLARAVRLTIFGQLIVAGVAFTFMAISSMSNFNSNTLTSVGISVIIVMEVVVQIVVVYLALRPEKRLMNFINHVIFGKEPISSVTHRKWDETSGLSAIMDFILEVKNSSSAAEATTTEEPSANSTPNFVLSALEITDIGIVMLNRDNKVIYRNDAAPVKTGYNNEWALDLLFEENDTITDWAASLEQRAVRADKVWKRIPNIPDDSEDKERRYYDVIASYSSGNDAEIILMIVDRTADYGRDEDDLNLIAFAAHELRGPITVIRGYLDILLEEADENNVSDEDKKLYERLIVSANRLSGYVSNILNTSRYDQRHLNINLKPQSVAAVFDSIEDDVKLRASSQGRLLAANIPLDLPIIAADTSGLGEVLTNLIDNAIKYSREGGTIEVNAQANGANVDINIVDHGIGMPPGVVSNLFRKFYRSHRSRGSAIGTGIGLYISKAIVESHGGNISVKSREGEGSTFTITLPTYDSVRDSLVTDGTISVELKKQSGGLIKNHGLQR